jgi:ABC-type antimicrobial peptide transport system permease subunit
MEYCQRNRSAGNVMVTATSSRSVMSLRRWLRVVMGMTGIVVALLVGNILGWIIGKMITGDWGIKSLEVAHMIYLDCIVLLVSAVFYRSLVSIK